MTAAAIDVQRLERQATRIRLEILGMVSRSNSSHIGPAYSIVDLLTALYFEVMRVDPQAPNAPDRDRFLLSKGHGGGALYATLACRGFFPTDWLADYYTDGGRFPGHIDRFSAPGIEISAGSLGHGLSMGVGMSYALKLGGRSNRTFVLVGDGECNEGSVWEAAMTAAQLKLENLTAIVDRNGLQGYSRANDILPGDSLSEKFQAFGWNTVECDGHDFAGLSPALRACSGDGRPTAVIARTVKGKGVSFMEDRLEWHYRTPRGELLEKAEAELRGRL